MAGCGMPGAPLPPSLNLPQPVKDLRAARNGDQVSLSWTMPRRNTDQLLLKDPLHVQVCRSENQQPVCFPIAQITLAPSASGSYTDQLPAPLASGSPRAASYFVQVENARGRSAGPSNLAHMIAGSAPSPVAALGAELRKSGVVLRWQPVAGDATAVRLERRLLTAGSEKKKRDPLEASPEPATQNLLISAHVAEGRALDRTTHMGNTYEYRAQRVARVTVDGQTLELASAASNAVKIEVRDIFPPDVPQGLAAVAASPESGAAVDLNWQPDNETDIAGYVVYRREGDGPWQRVSPAKPLTAPAFRDSAVQPGHSYRFTVTAIDLGGHESQRSPEAEETVPSE